MMKSIFGSKSFYEQERDKIKEDLKLPLLELVLEYLPHVQESIKEQEDSWELIAIKLNDHRFVDAIRGGTSSHPKGSKTKNNSREFNLSELPMLSGVFVKELFESIMREFEDGVPQYNWNHRIYRTRVVVPADGHQDGSIYYAFNFPVKEAYSQREDLICTELFYLKGIDVETKAKISKDKLIRRITEQESEKTLRIAEDLNQARISTNDKRLEACIEELKKKDLRIETLDRENKRLMELNQTLLEELNELRS
ncbi:hypothetical protein PSN45_003409 [Yamadazyma tenuis]|nr:hypothetical protein PSN45_003409 [Yamadazyma tenuis]